MNGPLRVLRVSLLCCAIACGMVLVFSAATKLQDMPKFLSTVQNHAVVPSQFTPQAAWLFAAVESVLGAGVIALVIAGHPRALMLAMFLIATFFAALALYAGVLWVHPPTIPSGCGCGLSHRVIENWFPILQRNTLISAAFGAIGLSLSHFGKRAATKA